MESTISVCRKGDDLFLTLEGDFNDNSSQELIDALKKVVLTSLKCSAPDSQVTYTFKTRGKVDLKEAAKAKRGAKNLVA
ncbi:MAG: hypothetical protein WCD80_07555 [Desulfobaccales bacterium]|jgi:hypothetical protein